METVSIDEAKANLSRLIDAAAKGKPFIITRAGKPLVKVVPLETREEVARRRIGFMDGRFEVPDDFDEMFQDEIEKMFAGEE